MSHKLIVAVALLTACLSLRTSAVPTGNKGIWYDPPGWISQCFVCPDNVTSDCMHAEPILFEINRRNHSVHVQQFYPDAYSEENGLSYKGKLTLNAHWKGSSEVMINLTCHWHREDGLDVLIIQHAKLRYYPQDGWSAISVEQEHFVFNCH